MVDHRREVRSEQRRLGASLMDVFLERIVLTLTILFVSVGGFLIWNELLIREEIVIAAVREDAKAYSTALTAFRSLYTSEVVQRLVDLDVEVTHDYEERSGAIPLPATLSMKIGERIGELGGDIRSRLYSPYPFPWREAEGGLRDKFSEDAWKALSTDPDEPYSQVEEINGRSWLRYATADRMRASCIDCHNTHASSPKSDWEVGDLRGVLEVDVPMDRAMARTRAELQGTILLYAVLGFVAVTVLAIVIGRLRRTSTELERRVAARTDELQRKNAELERFTYTVSHDLKTPLITIAGFAGLLPKKAAQGDVAGLEADVERIQRATRRMNLLLEDLLALSRIGHIIDASGVVDLGDVAEEALALCSGVIEARGVEVTIAQGLPAVVADRTRMIEVFQNLIENAVRFMGDQPAPRIEIGTEVRDGETVCFVRDNGVGIDPENLARVFGMFERLEERGEGTGIGLALVERIIEVHGGRIWAESEGKGTGTTFLFTVSW